MTTYSARRVVGITCTAAAALALAACGSANSAGGAANGPVSTRDVPGVGTVLVNTAGKTLYFTDTDQAGDIRCTGECLEFWQPEAAPGENVTGGPVPDISVVQRPEGTNQLTYQNKPLYTFAMETADKPASGHNLTRNFGGVDFTWHAVLVSGSIQPPPAVGGYDY